MSEGLPRRGAPKRATVADVAQRAGVSRQTVTRAVNDMTGINAATKARVLQVVKELKYRPSRFGRGLVLGHQPTVGFVLDDFANPYYSALAASVIATAANLGWSVVVADSEHSPGGVHTALKSLAGQVDAVIGYLRVPTSNFDDIFGDLPVVSFESRPERGHRGVIEFDFNSGIRQAIDYFRSQGRRRIVMIDAGSADEPTNRGLEYIRVMTELGLDPLMFFCDQSAEGGIRAAVEAAANVPDVDAIIAFNDMVAFGVVKALHRLQMDIPGHCAVIGVDGLSIGSVITPELSTLALDLTEVGRLAVEMAAGMHSGELPGSGPLVQRVVSHTLLLRESA